MSEIERESADVQGRERERERACTRSARERAHAQDSEVERERTRNKTSETERARTTKRDLLPIMSTTHKCFVNFLDTSDSFPLSLSLSFL